MEGLLKDRLLIERPRRLESFEEAVVHYPHKTLRGFTRHLRLSLLPTLLKGIHDGEIEPRYKSVDNEKFHLGSLKPKEHRALKKLWLKLEPSLVELLHAAQGDDRNSLFTLIAKAKAIFETQDLKCRRSFDEYLQNCQIHQLQVEPLKSRARAFADALVPPADAGQLRLKSFIHFLVNVPRHRTCSLKEDALEFLENARPDIVKALPGYVPAPIPVKPFLPKEWEKKAKHDPALVGLFDQSVFQDFRFLSLP